jgi:uncharacterized membrane protein YdjX (TVP38/TMEM64 family)
LPVGSLRLWKYSLLGAVVAAVITMVVLGALFLHGRAETSGWYTWWPHVSVEDVVQLVQAAGLWGVGASIGLMVIHSFVPFPAELIAIANGMVYGTVLGIAITWVGAMLGAFLAFGLARHFGRPFVGRVLAPRNMERVDAWVAQYGGGALLFSRFIPLIAFNLINYAAGLAGVSWWTFAWTTGVGILPVTSLMVIMGDRLDALPAYLWFLLLPGGLSLWWASHWWLRRARSTGTGQ